MLSQGSVLDDVLHLATVAPLLVVLVALRLYFLLNTLVREPLAPEFGFPFGDFVIKPNIDKLSGRLLTIF